MKRDARSKRRAGADTPCRSTRRRLLAALTAGALAPSLVRGQAAKRRPIVGIVRVNPRDSNETLIEPFRRDMASLGWTEQDNVEFQFAWAGGRNEAMLPLFKDMATRNVDVIVAFGPTG